METDTVNKFAATVSGRCSRLGSRYVIDADEQEHVKYPQLFKYIT